MAMANRMNSFKACSGFFHLGKAAAGFHNPDDKEQHQKRKADSPHRVVDVDDHTQMEPPLNCSGLWVISCQISDRYLFQVSRAFCRFCTTQLSDIQRPPFRQKQGRAAVARPYAAVFHQPVIRVKISLAKVITTPPAKVRKPLALWLGSWDLRERPICTTPKPSRIIPIARMRPKMKSLRLLITVKGSLAAKAVVVQQHSISTRAE